MLSHNEAKCSGEGRGRLVAARKGNVRTRGEFEPVCFFFLCIFFSLLMILLAFLLLFERR